MPIDDDEVTVEVPAFSTWPVGPSRCGDCKRPCLARLCGECSRRIQVQRAQEVGLESLGLGLRREREMREATEEALRHYDSRRRHVRGVA